MQKWEHKTLLEERHVGWNASGMVHVLTRWEPDVGSELSGLGDEGRELVPVVPRASLLGEAQAGVTSSTEWIFKRPLPEREGPTASD